ncbi:MAG TPA: hypothetical protein VMH90_06235 [Thermoplasmata archaeon]|nr:hypothetical protein [Thermoplasmata archaeon]
MALRRTSITLTLEREVTGTDGAPERLRLGATFEVPAEGPNGEALREALTRLREEIGELAGAGPGPRGARRSLEELIETYRPRQAELVELLREDGEISAPEAELLQAHLAKAPATTGPSPSLPVGVPPPTDRPIAAMPLENDRAPSTPRPVAQLLEQYRITSLKQAGAVRARRQISFEEYMALKRHFGAEAPPPPPSPGGTSEAHPSGGG